MFQLRVLSEFGVIITVIVIIITGGKCAVYNIENWCDPSHNRPCHGQRPNQVPKYQLLPIKRGNYFIAPCNGVVYRPNGEINVVKIANTLVDNFNLENNGTIFSCITYEGLELNFIGGRNIKTYERSKTTYLLYLDSETEVTTESEEKTETTAFEFPTEKNVAAVSETGSQSSQAALVGGILGAVIFILISILIAIWYRNKRRQQLANMADQFVYAGIEEIPPPLPPRRGSP